MKHLKLFKTQSEFDVATLELPNVSYVVENDTVYYHPLVAIDYSSQYLTFTALEDSTFKLTQTQNACKYSLDNGNTWVSLSTNFNIRTPTVSAGNKIMFKATNPSIGGYGSSNSPGIGVFSSTGKFNVSGNIMSMLYGDGFVDKNDLTGKNYVFYNLFKGCTKLVESHNLILPATTLASNCYGQMFYGCSSLTTAPELPATNLTLSCYRDMFYGCASLTTAPQLPATTLAGYCYNNMFRNCSKLNNIVMLATNTMADSCLTAWVEGVASTGTFVKHPDMTTVPGIPSGWTVVDYQE